MPSKLPIRIAMNEASRIGPRARGSFRSECKEQNRKQPASRKRPVSIVSPDWKRFRFGYVIADCRLPLAKLPHFPGAKGQ